MNTNQDELMEFLEEKNPEYDMQCNSKTPTHETHPCHEDEKRIDLLVQDMFFEHFFP